jgi:two-component system response regulator NreC
MLLNAQGDIEVVGEAGDGDEALRLVESLEPDVVLMDLAMPNLNGLEATARIKHAHPEVHVLALTMHDNEEYFFQLLRAGGSGYLLKKAAPVELVSAIRSVTQGSAYLYPSIARTLIDDYLRRVERGEEKTSYGGLTDREREVLRLFAEGLSNQQVAERLYLSVKTVQRHRENIMDKLDLHNRAQLISYAVRKGLIDLDAG